MAELPRHVGRQVDVETGYALVCNATPGGNPNVDALCGAPATHHVRWEEATTENGFACDEHLDFALGFGPFDVHSTENSACGLPGSFWVPRTPETASYCAFDLLDDDPALSGAQLISAGDTHG